MAHIVVNLVRRVRLGCMLVPVSGRVGNVVHAHCYAPRGPVVFVYNFGAALDFDVVD